MQFSSPNKPSINYYPVNPLILVILIQTNTNFITKQTIYKLPSCTSFNPGYPDMATPRCAIRQIQISSPNKPSINYHPVHPLILVILIQTNAIFITKQTIYKLPSCTSFNPGYPDSDLIIFCNP
jgi:hypothetical protein